MKTLKDFYIVVTKQNHEQITNLLCPSFEFKIGKFIHFDFDDVDSWCINQYTKNKERISLSKLKRYIDNTPTREGIKKAQNASKIYKYKYEQCKKENEYNNIIFNDAKNNYIRLTEDNNSLSLFNNALRDKLTETQTTLRNIEKIVMPDACEQDSTVIDWVKDIVCDSKQFKEERDLFQSLYNSELSVTKELKHSNERLQYNLDNLRSEREQLTNLAKKDVNLGNKTLIEWVEYIQENNKHMYKECTVLGISNKNLELNNTKLNLENDKLNKELRKYKTVAMCSLLLTLLALGLWF